MEKEFFAFLFDLDELMTCLELGIKNLKVIHSAISEGMVTNSDAADAIYCPFIQIHNTCKEMRQLVDAKFKEARGEV